MALIGSLFSLLVVRNALTLSLSLSMSSTRVKSYDILTSILFYRTIILLSMLLFYSKFIYIYYYHFNTIFYR